MAKKNNDFLGLDPPKSKKKSKKDKKKGKDKEPKGKKGKKKKKLEDIEEEDESEGSAEGGELSHDLKYSKASVVSSIEKVRCDNNYIDIEMMGLPETERDLEYEGGRKNSSKKSKNRLNDDESIEPDMKSARSAKSKKSDEKSAKSKSKLSRSDSYKEESDSKKKEKRSMDDYHKIDVSVFSLWWLGCVPSCCRTRYQKALTKLMKKAEYKLHREMDIGPFLKNVRDGRNLVRSF